MNTVNYQKAYFNLLSTIDIKQYYNAINLDLNSIETRLDNVIQSIQNSNNNNTTIHNFKYEFHQLIKEYNHLSAEQTRLSNIIELLKKRYINIFNQY